MPKIRVESIEDVYSFYAFLVGLDSWTVWNLPINDVKKIAINKLSIQGFINSD